MVAEAGQIARPAVEAGWERATARVLDRSGQPAGAAFLMPGNLVLTCAHVLSGVFGLPATEPLPADAEVMIDFPLSAQRPEVPARVLFSMPVAADNTGDIAVLRLAGSAPPDALPLRVIAADDLAGHRWRAFGFPLYSEAGEAKDAGIWTSGTIRGREGTGWWQLAVDPEEAFSLAGGFSGAAVWDDDYAGVVGVIVAVESDPGRRTGYALTVETLAGEWPELRAHLLTGCPYRALRPFTELDGGVFFGRDRETDRLAELVIEESRSIVPVFGPSGVGKSSLVGGGLLARLAETGGYLVAHVPHGVRYTASQLLAWALTSAGRSTADGAAWQAEWQALAASIAAEDGLAGAATAVLAAYPEGTRLLIVVDQFEALVSAEPQVARDLDTMLGALTRRWPDGTRRVQAVVVMRIDFLGQLEAFPNISAAWRTTNVVVPPMMREQLRQVISAPLADLKGIRFAAGLADQILHDTPTGPAALPLLEYTLTELWKRQARGVITTASYRELGGIDGALARSAERALWERADASELPAAERVLVQMVRPGEQLDAGDRAPDTRRVASRDEFDPAQWGLIHRLASARLVVITRQPAGPDTAELAHEALLDAWPRLADWVNVNRDFRTWQEGLRRARNQWLNHGQDTRFLLDGPQIAQAREWEGRWAEDVPSSERDFIAASITMAGRRSRRRRSLFGAAALALITAGGASFLAVQANVNGGIQHGISLSQQVASEAAGLGASQPNLAKQLQIAAYQVAHTQQAYSGLFSGEKFPGIISLPGVANAVYSQHHNLLALSSGQQVTLRSTATHSILSTVPASGGANWTAFNSASTLLAVAGGDGAVSLWNITQPGRPLPQASVTGSSVGPVSQVAFSPATDLLAAAGWDHSVRLWNVSDPAHPALLARIQAGVKVAASTAFSPDGQLLATADWDGFVRLWGITNPGRPSLLAAINSQQAVRSVAFSPAGSVLAVGADNSTSGHELHLWRIENPRKPLPLAAISAHLSTIAALAFSPTAPLLAATGSNAGTTALWNIADPAYPVSLPSLNGGSQCLAFSPDGQTLATLDQAGVAGRSPDDEVELWGIADPQTSAASATVPLAGPNYFPNSVALSPDVRVLAAAGAFTIRTRSYTALWDLSATQRPGLPRDLPAVGGTAALAMDGHRLLLAIGGSTKGYGLVALWDVTDFAKPVFIMNLPIGRISDNEIDLNLAFSPGGKLLAALDTADGTIWRWSLSDISRIVPLSRLTGVPYSLISVGTDGLISDTLGGLSAENTPKTAIWDTRGSLNSKPLAHVPQSVRESTAAVMDPAAPILANGDASGVVRLWSISPSGQFSLLTTMTGTTAPQDTLAFSPDGRLLASIDRNSNVHLWNISNPSNPSPIGAFSAPQDSSLLGVSLPVSASGSQFTETLAAQSGAISFWQINPGNLIGRMCAATGDAISAAQWSQYLPGQPYRPPCQAGG